MVKIGKEQRNVFQVASQDSGYAAAGQNKINEGKHDYIKRHHPINRHAVLGHDAGMRARLDICMLQSPAQVFEEIPMAVASSRACCGGTVFSVS